MIFAAALIQVVSVLDAQPTLVNEHEHERAAVVQSITSPFDVDAFDIAVAVLAIIVVAITYSYVKTANSKAAAAAAVMSAPPPPATTVVQRAFTLAELAANNGADASTPLYIACGGTVYDVSAGRGFYGPGG